MCATVLSKVGAMSENEQASMKYLAEFHLI